MSPSVWCCTRGQAVILHRFVKIKFGDEIGSLLQFGLIHLTKILDGCGYRIGRRLPKTASAEGFDDPAPPPPLFQVGPGSLSGHDLFKPLFEYHVSGPAGRTPAARFLD